MPLPAAEQAERKRALLVAALSSLDVEVEPTVSAHETTGYRSKITLVAKHAGRKGTILGAYRRGSHFVLDLDGCVIEESAIRRAATWLRDAARNIEAYDEASGRGNLRYVVMRAAHSGAVLVTLIGPGSAPAWAPRLARNMVDGGMAAGVSWSQNADRGNAIWRGEAMTLAGADAIEEDIDGLRFRLSPRSFFQVYRAQAARLRSDMVAALADCLEGLEGRQVWDLFTGAGANALRLAHAGARVTGLEAVPEAIDDARENARLNRLAADFAVCDLDGALPSDLPAPDAVVLNPPRRGAGMALIDAIAEARPRAIVYIACAPKPVARAFERLLARGYRIRKMTPYDLFPHTEHVETLALAERQTSL